MGMHRKRYPPGGREREKKPDEIILERGSNNDILSGRVSIRKKGNRSRQLRGNALKIKTTR